MTIAAHVIEAKSTCYILSYKSEPFVKHEFLTVTCLAAAYLPKALPEFSHLQDSLDRAPGSSAAHFIPPPLTEFWPLSLPGHTRADPDQQNPLIGSCSPPQILPLGLLPSVQ
jgi:hypothetical protein